MRTAIHWGLAMLTLLGSGCAKFDMSKNIPWGAGKDGEFSGNLRIVAVWQDTVLHQPDKPPIRGFGGRVFFYAGGEKPVKTQGRLEVYAFVEDGRSKTDTRPDRKYVFTPEQFEKHYSPKKPLGHSYSFWLPWDEAGGPELEITLVARFTPLTGGATIVSEQTHHALPGREASLAEKMQYRYLKDRDETPLIADKDGAAQPASAAQAGEAQLVGYEEPVPGYPGQGLDAPSANRLRMKTSTIDLPLRFNAGNMPTWQTSSPAGPVPASTGGYHGGQASHAYHQATVPFSPAGAHGQPVYTASHAYHAVPVNAGHGGVISAGGTMQGTAQGLSPLPPATDRRHQSYPQFRARPNPQYPGQAQPEYRSGVGAAAIPPTAGSAAPLSPAASGAPTTMSPQGPGGGTQYPPGLMPLSPEVNAGADSTVTPPVGYRPVQSRVLGAPIAPLERVHGPWLPDHVKWQYGLEPPPQRNFVTGPISRAANGS